jgi:hypothetical protein
MSRIKFKEFERTYGLSILLHSLASYKVGYRVEWKNRLHRKYEIEQNFFIDQLGFDEDTSSLLQQVLTEVNLQEKDSAQFAALELTRQDEIRSALKIPSFGLDLNGTVDTSKVVSFSYEGVRVLSLKDQPRSSVKKKIVDLREKNEKKFRRVSHIGFIEQLFYAERVVLDVDKAYERELKASLERANINFDAEGSGMSSKKVIFSSNSTCPFAARFDSVADLVD